MNEERTRKNIVEIAEKFVPLLKEMGSNRSIIELPCQRKVENESTNILFKRRKTGEWDIEIRRFERGDPVTDWEWIARLVPTTTYRVEI